MRKELAYFKIDDKYGGYQDWFLDPMMRLGGCAAATACDSSIYFALHRQIPDICPMELHHLNRQDYIQFAKQMKPYLAPRWTGIDRLDIYMDGYGQYLRDQGNASITMEGLSGLESEETARQKVCQQIDAGLVIPFLTLKHQDPNLSDYVWHWYLLTGYEIFEDTMLVKAVTYGSWRWLDFHSLWDTGYEAKGGMILYTVSQ